MDQDGFSMSISFDRNASPNAPFIRRFVSPKAALNDRVARFGSNPNQIVEASVGEPLHIQIDRRAIDLKFRAANDVKFFLTDLPAP
jgi:hypothetical protein